MSACVLAGGSRVARHLGGSVIREAWEAFTVDCLCCLKRLFDPSSDLCSFPTERQVQAKAEQTNSAHTRGQHCGWEDRKLHGYTISAPECRTG